MFANGASRVCQQALTVSRRSKSKRLSFCRVTSVIPASLVAPDRGKTFVLTYATIYRALHSPNSRHAISV